MRRLSVLALTLAALMLACNIPTPQSPAATSQPPAATNTPQPPVTPTVAETPALQPNVQCNEISFYLDPAIASTYNCETVPPNLDADPWQTPQHTRITLEGYALPGEVYFRRINVYRLADFLALQPQAAARVDALRSLTAGGSPGPDALPVLDIFGAAQVFHAHYRVVPFVNGSGIRFISEYAQYCAPINNEDMFLVYQGLTGDGQFYVSAVLHISHPSLPASAMPFPGGVDQGQFCDQYESYIADITNQLNAQPEASFLPSITLFDSLIVSITISP
ncbi:MAG: hypothetical protein JW929_06105 [Anaerolineales bacterium]|nr:hypothetical protein [Anaerolineales bacterium]